MISNNNLVSDTFVAELAIYVDLNELKLKVLQLQVKMKFI